MIKLRNEYTDRKKRKHSVRHHSLNTGEPAYKEAILEEIRNILENQAKKCSGISSCR